MIFILGLVMVVFGYITAIKSFNTKYQIELIIIGLVLILIGLNLSIAHA